MFLTTHAAAGIAISQYTPEPLAAFGFSLLSHFVLDFIPHGDERLYHDEEWKVLKKYRRALLVGLVDLVGVVFLVAWISQHPFPVGREIILLGVLGSILPDFLSHLFPVLHERFSWLFLMRWLYRLTKPTGVRYLVRGQNWIHNLLHHEIIRRDIPFAYGLVMQVLLVAVFLFMVVS